MKLEAQHFRAIQDLSMGMSADEVIGSCKISKATLYRWKSDPDFAAALAMELKKTQAAVPEQLQIIANESFCSIRDAQRELRAYGLGKKNVEYARVMSLLGILKFGARWISLSSFDPALKEAAAKLAFQKPDDPNAQEVPDIVESDQRPAPEPLPLGELRCPPAVHGAYTAEELSEWVRADRIARGLALPEEIDDELEARKQLLLGALREIEGLQEERSWSAGGSPASDGQTSDREESSNVEESVAECATGGLSTSANAAENVSSKENESVTRGSGKENSADQEPPAIQTIPASSRGQRDSVRLQNAGRLRKPA